MSKNQKQTQNVFKYTPTTALPKLGKIKDQWDLKNLYYTSEKDPQIEKDIIATERAYKAFAQKYRGKDFTSTAKKLFAALSESEKLSEVPAGSKPIFYYSFRTVLNAHDTVAQKQLTLIENRLTKAGNEVLFFGLEIGKISKELQKKYLKDHCRSSMRM